MTYNYETITYSLKHRNIEALKNKSEIRFAIEAYKRFQDQIKDARKKINKVEYIKIGGIEIY